MALVGRNGSGKSTVLQLLAALLQPVSGAVSLDGHGFAAISTEERARAIGFLPQEVRLLYDLTVWDAARLGRYTHGTRFRPLGPKDREAVESSLELVEMTDFRERRLSTLSGGERRRALLASVLSQEPAFLLLDEPAAMLDLHHQVGPFRVLRRLRSRGIGIVASCHDLNLASFHCDRMILLVEGRVRQDASPGLLVTEDLIREVYGSDTLLARLPGLPAPAVLPAPPEEGD